MHQRAHQADYSLNSRFLAYRVHFCFIIEFHFNPESESVINIKYKLVISLKPITGLHNQIRNLEAIHVLNVYGPSVEFSIIVLKKCEDQRVVMHSRSLQGIKRGNSCSRRSQEQRYLLECSGFKQTSQGYHNWIVDTFIHVTLQPT